jgi:hypothetical protein
MAGSLSDRVYSWDKKMRAKKRDAESFGRVVETIQRKNGRCRAADIVEAARPETSEIHGLFQWSDEVAGESWRQFQARYYLRRLQVTIVGEQRSAVIPAMICVRRGDGYQPTENVMRDSSSRALLISGAMEDARAFRRRYQRLQEVGKIVDAINEVEHALVGGELQPATPA